MCPKRGGPAPSGAPTPGEGQMKRALSAATLILATVIAACAPTTSAGPSPTGGNQPKKGGTLILARAGEVTNLDPHKVPAFTSARVFELVYSYLMRLDENLGVQPDLAEWVPDNFMRFDANKDYYVSGQPYLDGIRINVVPDESSLTAALRTKAADMAIVTDAKVARTLRSETAVTLDAKPSLSYNLLFVNTKRPPLDNIKVRQAIAYAIDR